MTPFDWASSTSWVLSAVLKGASDVALDASELVWSVSLVAGFHLSVVDDAKDIGGTFAVSVLAGLNARAFPLGSSFREGLEGRLGEATGVTDEAAEGV